MTPLPFRPTELRRPTLLHRLRGAGPPENALAELVNLLAESESVVEVAPARVEEIEARYELRLREAFPGETEALYRDFLLHCLSDRRLTEEELDAAGHLAVLLGLPAERSDLIQRQAARAIFLGSVEEVLSDGVVDPRERAFLEWLRQRLGIPEDAAENMLQLRERQRRERRGRSSAG